MTRIVLVRHGQTSLNQGDRIRGRLDPPLDERGLHQARRVARYIALRWALSAVYSSPLQRAIQTARAIAGAQGLEAVAFDGLLDLDFGEWHGLSYAEAQARYPALHRTWRMEPFAARFPGGESLEDVRQRALGGISEVAARHGGQTIAMVGHTVVNRAILCSVLNVADAAFWRFGQDTSGVNVLTVAESGEFELTLANDTVHLTDVLDL